MISLVSDLRKMLGNSKELIKKHLETIFRDFWVFFKINRKHSYLPSLNPTLHDAMLKFANSVRPLTPTETAIINGFFKLKVIISRGKNWWMSVLSSLSDIISKSSGSLSGYEYFEQLIDENDYDFSPIITYHTDPTEDSLEDFLRCYIFLPPKGIEVKIEEKE